MFATRWRDALTLIAVSSIVLAGCSGRPDGTPAASPSQISPGLEAQFDAELALTLSDYSRGILKDKKITGVEYQDADSRYVECVNESFPGRVSPAFYSAPQPDGTMGHSFKGTDEDLALFDRIEPVCLREFMGDGAIDALYWQGIKNPQALPLKQLILNCLVAKALVDPDTYGVDQVSADIAHTFGESDANPAAATGLDFSEGEAFECYAFQN